MEVKKREDHSNLKQMTFSNRRKAIFKKAHQISLLCDAEVSIIICSTNKNIHEYTTPNSTMKKILDQYQSTVGVDLWSTHYEKMQEELRRLKEENSTLRREIKQRIGTEVTDDLCMKQLCSLEDEMLFDLERIRYRKMKLLDIQTDVYRKKVKLLEDMQEELEDLVTEYEYPNGVVENKGKYATPGFSEMLLQRSPEELRVEGSFEHEGSIVGSTVTMDIEDSP